jgi:hypothetical protein
VYVSVSHLHTLEHIILQELYDTEDKIKSKIDNRLKQLSQNSKNLDSKVCHGVDKKVNISYHDIHND